MTAVHVTVRVGAELYALPVDAVLEIAEVGRLTPVPGARSGTLGLQNLRGSALPVFDLACLLGVSGSERPARVVIVDHEGCRAGLAVDEACDVGGLPEGEAETGSELLAAAALTDGGLVGMIDVERLFAELQGSRAA
jgi:purine-binding chemotaxis protein CheW